jgi:hypothetical protein
VAESAPEPPDKATQNPSNRSEIVPAFMMLAATMKQRHRQQDEAAVKPLHDLLARKREVHAAKAQVDQCGKDDRIADGRADPRKEEQRGDTGQNLETHTASSP